MSSKDGRRWVQYNGPRDIDCQPVELLAEVVGDQPVEVLPFTGVTYTPTAVDDPVGVFLRARRRVRGEVVVTGAPPNDVPQIPAGLGAMPAGTTV